MIRKISLLVVYLTLFVYAANAQRDSLYYFNSKNQLIPKSDSAAFYRKFTSRQGDMFTYTEYHKDGITIKASAIGNMEHPSRRGDTYWYYANGKLMQKITYKMESGIFIERLMYHADSTGKTDIVNGNGTLTETGIFKLNDFDEKYTWKGPYKNGMKDGVWNGTDNYGINFEEKYKYGHLISGKSISAAGTKYRYLIGTKMQLIMARQTILKGRSDTI